MHCHTVSSVTPEYRHTREYEYLLLLNHLTFRQSAACFVSIKSIGKERESRSSASLYGITIVYSSHNLSIT